MKVKELKALLEEIDGELEFVSRCCVSWAAHPTLHSGYQKGNVFYISVNEYKDIDLNDENPSVEIVDRVEKRLALYAKAKADLHQLLDEIREDIALCVDGSYSDPYDALENILQSLDREASSRPDIEKW